MQRIRILVTCNTFTLLDNTSFQVCIGLRLGCNLCTPHICKCNAKVDEIGIHGLSCSKSSGRFSRHTEINSVINRSLTSIHVNSTLEPNQVLPLKWLANASIANIVQLFRQTTYLKV
jgi:hypothetical protein